MPIMSRAQVERMIFMCGASLPTKLIKLIHRYEHNADDLRKAGVEYAFEQADDLLKHGVDGIHFYSMNRPEVARAAITRYKQ
jgi:methylenetetrahydrofolate reductase (NADPH)